MYWVKIKIKVFILTFCLSSAASQSCDSSRFMTQCSEGEICRNNRCEDAVYCDVYGNNPCVASPGLSCISDYCQPNPCTSTGQCVHGHVCSQDTIRRCVYPIVINIEEGSEVKFDFKEPGTPGNYEEILWHKGDRSSLDRAAFVHPVITDSKPQYYNDFCSGKSPCRTSDRAHLNTDTGELTIHSVKLSDEDFYYYEFYNYDDIPNTGIRYEYKLNVYVTDDVTLDIPDNYVTVGTSLTLTCTADRIKPEPLAMYWEIHGTNELGTLTTRDDDGDGVFTQRNVYVHMVTKEDEGNPVKCVVVPRFGQTITVEKTLNIGYAPTGKPTIEVFPAKQYNGEKVTLTCENPEAVGNPPCYAYDWIKQEGNSSNLPNTQVYTFIMDEFHSGNYSCRCRNVFGQSDDSDIVEIVNRGKRPEIDSVAEHNGGLIAGCVIGVLVLVALVILGVIVFKRYKGKFNLKFKPKRERAENVSSVDNGGYVEPVNNNPNPYEDVDNGENNVNQYQEVNNGANIGNQYNIINGGNNGNQYDVINGGNIGNQYDVINEAAMAMPRGAGFVNPGMTTYEEVL